VAVAVAEAALWGASLYRYGFCQIFFMCKFRAAVPVEQVAQAVRTASVPLLRFPRTITLLH
jgi:hypothetical protein